MRIAFLLAAFAASLCPRLQPRRPRRRSASRRNIRPATIHRPHRRASALSRARPPARRSAIGRRRAAPESSGGPPPHRCEIYSPDWSPPAEVKRDNPRLPNLIKGGHAGESMGAARWCSRAASTPSRHQPAKLHRRFVSYGCIRMFNGDILDLYSASRSALRWSFRADWRIFAANARPVPVQQTRRRLTRSRSMLDRFIDLPRWPGGRGRLCPRSPCSSAGSGRPASPASSSKFWATA